MKIMNLKTLAACAAFAVAITATQASANTKVLCFSKPNKNGQYKVSAVSAKGTCRPGYSKGTVNAKNVGPTTAPLAEPGPQGAKGDTGATGETGAQGEAGPQGVAGMINLGSCTQVEASRTGSGEETQRVYCPEGDFLLSASWGVSNQVGATTYRKDLFSTLESGPYNYPVGVEIRSYLLVGQYTLDVTATCCEATLGGNNNLPE